MLNQILINIWLNYLRKFFEDIIVDQKQLATIVLCICVNIIGKSHAHNMLYIGLCQACITSIMKMTCAFEDMCEYLQLSALHANCTIVTHWWHILKSRKESQSRRSLRRLLLLWACGHDMLEIYAEVITRNITEVISVIREHLADAQYCITWVYYMVCYVI